MKTKKQLMTLSTILAAAGMLVSVGCKPQQNASTDVDDPSKGYGFVPRTNQNQMARLTNQADNTRVNVRATAEQALTAGDEGATEADRDITQQIRTRLNEDTALAGSAKNVKIATANRKVTLTGSVGTENEKTSITTMAKSIAGDINVDDQLAVKPYQ